jgi:biopolymer transport protein ExbD
MAPMIDMVFLLLVFFMTVSTLAKDARPAVPLPLSSTSSVPEAAPPRDIITVMASPDGFRHFWHNREVSSEELEKLLQEPATEGGEQAILLRGPPDLPWSAWQAVVDLCREAGVMNMHFATHEGQ